MRRRDILGAVGGIAALSNIPQVQALSAKTISYGDSVTGVITEDSPTDPNYSDFHTQPYEFEADKGDNINITLNTPSADEWLRVESPDGTDVVDSENDNVEFEATSSGVYTIFPQSYPQEEPGEFTLELKLVGGSQGDDDSESTESNESTDSIDPAPDPAYTVETNPIAATNETAVFEILVSSNPDALEDYEAGSVSSLEFTIDDGLEFSRIIPIPDEDGQIIDATGSMILSAGTLATAGTTEAILGVISLGISVGDFIEEATDETTSSNVRSIRFSGDSTTFGTPDDELFSGDKRYLIEVESSNPIDDAYSMASTWSSMFGFGYLAEPTQNPSETDIGEQYYVANVEGGLAGVDDPEEFTC